MPKFPLADFGCVSWHRISDLELSVNAILSFTSVLSAVEVNQSICLSFQDAVLSDITNTSYCVSHQSTVDHWILLNLCLNHGVFLVGYFAEPLKKWIS